MLSFVQMNSPLSLGLRPGPSLSAEEASHFFLKALYRYSLSRVAFPLTAGHEEWVSPPHKMFTKPHH